jgi:hypothetical protein
MRTEAMELVRAARELLGATDRTPQYRQKAGVVSRLIKELDKALTEHGKQQKGDTANYGYIGDLGHIEEELKELVRFLSGKDK